MNKGFRFNAVFIVLTIASVLVMNDVLTKQLAVANIPYSQFQALVRDKKVDKVVIGADRIEGTLKESLDGKTRFVTTRVDPDISKELDTAGVTYPGRIESSFLPMLLSWILPVVFFFGVWMWLGKRMGAGGPGGPGGGLMAISKSKAKVYVETDTRTCFADVAGVDEAKDELREVVSFLKDPKSYGRLGARMPKGVLLVGLPGTGKTLLAEAVAGEAGVPFLSISGSEFVEMFVGVGAARVRDLFEQARKKAPAIIFIDELDALGRARASMNGMGGGHDEKEQTLNQLLVELDGFDSSSGLEKRNRLLNPRKREVVAHHELGHAFVAAALPGTDPVHKISIIPRGIGALGYTIQRPTEDRLLMTREELINKMAVLMGGRAAEHVVFGHSSTGASDDISKATDIARNMVTRFGMGGRLGPVTYESEPNGFLGQVTGVKRLYAEETAREIDMVVRDLVDAAFQRARKLQFLKLNRELLSAAARELLEKESLADGELQALLGRVQPEERLAA